MATEMIINIYWCRALDVFRKHETKSPIHKLSLERQLAFRKVIVTRSQKAINWKCVILCEKEQRRIEKS